MNDQDEKKGKLQKRDTAARRQADLGSKDSQTRRGPRPERKKQKIKHTRMRLDKNERRR